MRSGGAEPLGICLLAGGEARRFPGKLECRSGGVPLVVRAFNALRECGDVFVSANRTFATEVEHALDAPVVADRWPGRGPLGGMLSTAGVMRHTTIFVAAADAPFLGAAVVDELRRSWTDGIEAVVPVHEDGTLEPLCALYDRRALLREGFDELRRGSGAPKAVVERLQARRVRISDERVFMTMNDPMDTALLEECR